MIKDLKYLFAYTIPVATLVSITSEGFFTYTTLIYAFYFYSDFGINNERF